MLVVIDYPLEDEGNGDMYGDPNSAGKSSDPPRRTRASCSLTRLVTPHKMWINAFPERSPDMTTDELLRRVGDHEDNFIERKPEGASPAELRQTPCAFANTVPEGREPCQRVRADRGAQLLLVASKREFAGRRSAAAFAAESTVSLLSFRELDQRWLAQNRCSQMGQLLGAWSLFDPRLSCLYASIRLR